MKFLEDLFNDKQTIADVFPEDLRIANYVYLAASLIDFVSSAVGIKTGQVEEMSPVIKPYIQELGPYGIFIPKSLIAYGSITLLNFLNNQPIFKNKIKFKAKPTLYASSAITGITGLSWLIEKYFS